LSPPLINQFPRPDQTKTTAEAHTQPKNRRKIQQDRKKESLKTHVVDWLWLYIPCQHDQNVSSHRALGLQTPTPTARTTFVSRAWHPESPTKSRSRARAGSMDIRCSSQHAAEDARHVRRADGLHQEILCPFLQASDLIRHGGRNRG